MTVEDERANFGLAPANRSETGHGRARWIVAGALLTAAAALHSLSMLAAVVLCLALLLANSLRRSRPVGEPLWMDANMQGPLGSERTWIHSYESPCSDARVTVEGRGESRMGSTQTMIRLDRPVEGVWKFRCNNGRVTFDEHRPWVLLNDGALILLIGLDRPVRAWHLESAPLETIRHAFFMERGLVLLTEFAEFEGELDGELRERRGRRELFVPFDELRDGLGPAADGRMPTAPISWDHS